MSKITTKDKIIQVAIKKLLAHGYNNTTVDEIVETAAVAKGSFYYAFKSKEDLAVAALDEKFASDTEIVMAGSWLEEDDPWLKAISYLGYMIERSSELWAQGSLMGKLSLDTSSQLPKLKEKLQHLLKIEEDFLTELYTPLEEYFSHEEAPNGSLLAQYYLAMIEGSVLMSEINNDMSWIKNGINQFKVYLYSLTQ